MVGGAPTDASGEVPRAATHAAARRIADDCTRYVSRTAPVWPVVNVPFRLTVSAEAVALAGTAATDGTRRDDAGVPVGVTPTDRFVAAGAGE